MVEEGSALSKQPIQTEWSDGEERAAPPDGLHPSISNRQPNHARDTFAQRSRRRVSANYTLP